MNTWIKLLSVAFIACWFTSCDDDNPVTGEDIQEEEGYAYVDLGLPSGTLWATEDVSVDGSTFFAWGETKPKSSYTSVTYAYAEGSDKTLTKYCTADTWGADGFIDGLLFLQPEDDAAHVNWGGEWCVPIWEEWQELYDNCTWETVQADDGTFTFVATSKLNGNQITFPATGAMQGEKTLYAGNGSYYWASTLLTSNCMYAAGLSLSPQSINLKEGKRPMGHCIRAVIPGDRVSLQAIDLGLPSGIKWAATNIGAISSDAAGLLYAWGESVPKPRYDFTNYTHCEGSPKTLTKYCTDSELGNQDNLTRLEEADDAAAQVLGNGWRMPTAEEMDELMTQCTWTVGEIDGQKVWTVTGPNGNSITLPLVGTMWEETLEFDNMRGFYWTSDLDEESCQFGQGLFLNPQSFSWGNGFQRASGRSIRPVHE